MTLAADMPTVFVEAAFGFGPFQTGKTWTDISQYWRSIVIDRGRSYTFEDFQTGTCDILLNNSTGVFHPLYTGGPYYGKLLPNTPIRVRAVWSGTSYTLFFGFVNGWPPMRFGGRRTAQAQIACVDMFGLFQNMRFPLVDDGVGGGAAPTVLGVYTYSSGKLTGTNSMRTDAPASRVYGLVEVTEMLSGPPASFQSAVIDVQYTTGAGVGNRLGQLNLQHRFPSIHPHHVRRRKQHHRHARGHHFDEGAWRTRIDMQLQGTDLVRSIQSCQLKTGTFTGKDFKLTLYGEQPILAQAGGDKQLAQALAYVGVPTSYMTAKDSAFYGQIQHSPWDTTLLDVVRLIQESELGQIYPDRTGNLQFESRDWRLKNWSASTWHDGGGVGALVYAEAEPDYSNTNVTTMWELTRVSRSPNDNPQRQVAKDGTNHDRYGFPNAQRTTAVVTDDVAQGQAQYLLAHTKDPHYRFARITVKPRANPAALWPVVLPMDVSTGMTVKEYPPTAAGSFSVSTDQWVEHLTHMITPDDWILDVETSARQQIG